MYSTPIESQYIRFNCQLYLESVVLPNPKISPAENSKSKSFSVKAKIFDI
jgi:hypothetical protein